MSDTAILAAVDARRQDLIGVTQDLMRIPTLNPPRSHILVHQPDERGQTIVNSAKVMALVLDDVLPGGAAPFPRVFARPADPRDI